MSGFVIDKYEVKPGDLELWMQQHHRIKWIFARSMPQTPHYYMVKGRNVAPDIFDLAFGVRRTWGVPGKFWSKTQLYLHHTDIEHVRYWSLDYDPARSVLMNMADDGKVYGRQDAPDTSSGAWAEYDQIGAYWDYRYREVTRRDGQVLWKLVNNNISSFKPTLLDIGAGTGATLEASITASWQTTAVDPSQAMLNDYVIKNPQVKEVFVGTLLEWLEQTDDTRDIAVASTGSASYLTPDEVSGAVEMANELTVLSFYAEVPTHRKDYPETHEKALTTALGMPGAKQVQSGKFVYVLIP